MFKAIKKYLLRKARMLFLQHKTFFGSYADNFIEIKKFVASRRVIICHYQSSDLRVPYLSDAENKEMHEVIIAEQKRLYRREMRKKKKAVLFYVEDNFFTRQLGYYKTKFHYQFSA